MNATLRWARDDFVYYWHHSGFSWTWLGLHAVVGFGTVAVASALVS